MLSRFSSTALSGTSTDRNTSISSRNDSASTAPMNTGSRSLTRVADVGEARRLRRRRGPAPGLPASARAARRRAAARSCRPSPRPAGRCRERRPASRCPPPVDLRRRRPTRCPGRRRPRRRAGPARRRVAGEVDGDDERAVGARAEALGDEVVGPALGPAAGSEPSSGMPTRRPSTGAASGEQQRGRADRVGARVPRDVPRPSAASRVPRGVAAGRTGARPTRSTRRRRPGRGRPAAASPTRAP